MKPLASLEALQRLVDAMVVVLTVDDTEADGAVVLTVARSACDRSHRQTSIPVTAMPVPDVDPLVALAVALNAMALSMSEYAWRADHEAALHHLGVPAHPLLCVTAGRRSAYTRLTGLLGAAAGDALIAAAVGPPPPLYSQSPLAGVRVQVARELDALGVTAALHVEDSELDDCEAIYRLVLHRRGDRPRATTWTSSPEVDEFHGLTGIDAFVHALLRIHLQGSPHPDVAALLLEPLCDRHSDAEAASLLAIEFADVVGPAALMCMLITVRHAAAEMRTMPLN